MFAVGAGGDHSDFCAGFALLKAEVILCGLREIVEVLDALGGGLPALHGGVAGEDFVDAADVGGYFVSDFAVDLVAGADLNFREFVEDVELGDDEPLGGVDLVGVAEERHVEPAAATLAAGDGAELHAATANVLADFAGDFGGERTFADAGDISLGDADDGADVEGADAGSCGGSAGGGTG